MCFVSFPTPSSTHQHRSTARGQPSKHKKQQMDLSIEGLNGVKHTVELGEDDTPAELHRKVASAVGLPEDGFAMSFGEEAMDEGYDMTQLSTGDTVVLAEAKVKKYAARAALHALGETDITAEKLRSVRDPEVACLLLQAEVATVIPDEFLLKASLTSLDLSAESVVTQICDRFLVSCTSLTSINLAGLVHVTQIGHSFLAECSALRTLDLTPLGRVAKIEDSFLVGCSALRTLDLPSNVTQIEGLFLAECSALCTLDLTPLSSVTKIGQCFLYACDALRTLDLTPLSSVTQIESSFLSRCSALCTLNLTPLSRVAQIGSRFLHGCTSLRSIYLSGLSDFVSSTVRKERLWFLVVQSRPKRSRDKPPKESRKRRRHAE